MQNFFDGTGQLQQHRPFEGANEAIYHLSCPYCLHLWWSEEAFPKKCPKCKTKFKE